MDSGLELQSWLTEVIVSVGSGLVALHLKSTFTSKLFAISRSWLTLGRMDPPGSARAQMSKHQNIEIRDMVNIVEVWVGDRRKCPKRLLGQREP